ncbi:MAG TPA: thiolase family protein [Hyphomicrobiaceae bacterium]|nr:thiolase family protein [Hyphomicrobiaceae bacterium]
MTSRAFLLGGGMTRFGHHADISAEQLAVSACVEAIKDSGLELRDIQAAYFGHVTQGMTFGARVLDALGVAGIPVVNVENACASSSTALHLACVALAAGQYERILVVGAEKMQRGILPLNQMMDSDLEAMVGVTVPSQSALYTSRYMSKYDLSVRDLAAVAVKNRRNAALNDYAQHRTPVTIEEVLASPVISSPLTRLMCCPTSDGAAAVVIGTAAEARRGSAPIEIRASVIEGGHLLGVREGPNTSARAARRCFEQAGVAPSDIDVVEALDYTSMAEIQLYEDFGFCASGGGAALVRNGDTELTGKVAFSPGGGLLGRGHPLGATGIAQAVEALWQLRGQAGKRQVAEAKVALTHAAGGVITGVDDEAVVTMHLFVT